MSLKWKADAPFELIRWRFVEKYGWTLAQVDEMSMADLHEWLQIQDAKAKVAGK